MNDENGLELAGAYYREVVAPLLSDGFPGLAHAAARLGSGSDVLGLDDAMSQDHDWGLRLTLLVDGPHVARTDEYLQRVLPDTFAGWPTRFATTWDPTIRHRVEVDTPDAFAASRLGMSLGDLPLEPLDWLSLTGQALLEVTAGAVYYDSHGGISALRRRLTWYPDDVWRYVVAVDWCRIAEELPLVGRAGHRGDDVGSRVIAGRLVRCAMHLGFLLERRWPPFPKWLGTAFTRLPGAGSTASAMASALAAERWQDRQTALCDALTGLHHLQRSQGLPTGPEVVEAFFDRPFYTISDTVTTLLIDSITDRLVRRLPPGVGSIEQWVDNVDVLTTPQLRASAANALRSALSAPPST